MWISRFKNLTAVWSLDVSIKGSGPLEDIDIKLDANSQNQQILIGDLSLREAEGGLGFDADLSGQLAGLIAPQYREFFAGQSKIEAAGQTRILASLRRAFHHG